MQNRYRPSSLNSLWAILGANVLLYIISLVVFNYVYEPIFDYLGLSRGWVLSRPWTIITSMFAHDPYSFLHIIINMWMLYLFGSYIIRLVGERKFLLVYFVGGIVGGLFFILLSNKWVIGASGAVFALGAMLAVMMPKMRVIMFPIFVPVPLWGAILFGMVITSFVPGVAWQAHLGGAIAGAAFGFYFRRKQPRMIFSR